MNVEALKYYENRALRMPWLLPLMTIVLLGATSCRSRQTPSGSTPPASLGLSMMTHNLRTPAHSLSGVKKVGIDEAYALRDELNDGMIATMLRYMNDCDRMADELEHFLSAHEGEYETVAASLIDVPWPDQELPPDKLRRRLQKADETIAMMEPAAAACRSNSKAIAVMRVHFYGE